MAFIQINSTKYYYELHGKGTQPLILIAGYTCDHTFYYPVLEVLSPYFKILVLDNRGVGQTIDDVNRLSAELLADDIMTMAEQLNLHKPHVIGQSMGGTIAQTIASRYADKIGKLVLLTTSAKWRHTMLNALQALINLRKKNVDFNLQFDAIIPWLFGEDFLSEQKNIDEFKHLLLSAEHPQSLENQCRQYEVLTQYDGRKYLNGIKAKTLIVYGIYDLIALPSEARYLQEHISQAEIVELSCGHVITGEAPKKLGKALVEFLV